MPSPDYHKKFSYSDYLLWDESERFELIDGVAYNMSPAPSPDHQRILGRLYNQLSSLLGNKGCEVFIAPFDVRLFAEEKDDHEVENVVQPDLTVICDKSKIDDKGLKGKPDLVIEILSPSSIRHDRWTKFKLYEKAGVSEFWIVDIMNESIEVFSLKDGIYSLSGYFSKDEILESILFLNLTLDLSLIFN